MTPRSSFLTALTIGMLAFSSPGATAPQAPEPRTIEVTARRFTFEPSTIEATEGERLRLVVTSGDGVHGVEIKKFKVNKEIPRGGDPVVIEFTASEAGRFPIICSAFCGDGHGDMKGLLVVLAREKDK
jgi:cytochrome c oxidase subunit 2